MFPDLVAWSGAVIGFLRQTGNRKLRPWLIGVNSCPDRYSTNAHHERLTDSEYQVSTGAMYE